MIRFQVIQDKIIHLIKPDSRIVHGFFKLFRRAAPVPD
jgi:hypothetical protein